MTEGAAQWRFSLPLTVRFADTDLQGHVYFSNYLIYCDEALSAYLEAVGCGWRLLAERGLEFVFVDTGCQFLGRAGFEDLLQVHARIGRIGTTSFTGEMSIWRAPDERPVATGHITSVMVARDTGRPVPVPDWFRQAVARWEGS